MLSGITTIYLQTELLFPPLPAFLIKQDQVLGLYNDLRKSGAHAYQNLELQADPPTLSTRHEIGQSRCQIGGGKIRIEEDTGRADVDDFTDSVKAVLRCLGPNVGPFYSHRCLVRCTGQPMYHPSSLLLLAGRVANVISPIEPFGRPPAHFGVRFRFPPIISKQEEAVEPKAEEASPPEKTGKGKNRPKKQKSPADSRREEYLHKGHYTLRFETASDDIKKVWMELAAEFNEEIVDAKNTDVVVQNIRSSHRFLIENAKQFLDQFDSEPKSDEDDAKEK